MVFASIMAAAALAASTAEPVGFWHPAQDADHVVRIAPCGSHICGFAGPKAAALAPAGSGAQILDLRAAPEGADEWRGRVIDPRHGRAYKASLKMLDADHLRLTGCLVGPLCRSEVWTRTPASVASVAPAPVN